MMIHSESIEPRVHSFAPWQLCAFALKEMGFLFITQLLARRRGHQTLVAANGRATELLTRRNWRSVAGIGGPPLGYPVSTRGMFDGI